MPEEPLPHRSEKFERRAAWCFRTGIQVYSWGVFLVIVVVALVYASKMSQVGVEKIKSKEKMHWQQKGPLLPGAAHMK